MYILPHTSQLHMGSPLFSGFLNLFMEYFEEKALNEAPHPHKYWGRYVDDTGVLTKYIYEEELFDHINKQRPNIKFTIEREDQDNSLQMLDLKLIRTDNTILTDIYWKPIHTDQYLQWTSHPPVQQNLVIEQTLMYRADTLIAEGLWRKRRLQWLLENVGTL